MVKSAAYMIVPIVVLFHISIIFYYYFDSKADMKKLNNRLTGPYYMHCPNPTEREPLVVL